MGNGTLNDSALPAANPALLSEVISAAADLSLVIEPDGRVVSYGTGAGARPFGDLASWTGRDLREVLTGESVPKFEDSLKDLKSGNRRQVELNLQERDMPEIPVRFRLVQLDEAGRILMLGSDLRATSEAQQRLVRTQFSLEREYERQREFDTRYRVLMDATRDAFLLLDVTSERILDANPPAEALLGAPRVMLMKSRLGDEFSVHRQASGLSNVAGSVVFESDLPVDLIARRSEIRVHARSVGFRTAGQPHLLLRLEPADQVLDTPLAEKLTSLFQQGADSVIFTDAAGIIQNANEAFLNLSNATNLSAIRGRSLGDFLGRGEVDLRVLIENAVQNGSIRIYATRLVGMFSTETSVEISTTYFKHPAHPVLAFVIREASRAESGESLNDIALQSVMEQVGSSTMRDIVSDINDVVEKMCIETALNLTRDNRVAAAEMLGLSRQSLYVKLRKFDLIRREEE